MTMTPGNTIVRAEFTNGEVVVTLANGVTMHLSSNPGYLHLAFSGIKELAEEQDCYLVASGFHNHPELPNRAKLANYVDLTYKPAKE
jgi:hypothetical protein